MTENTENETWKETADRYAKLIDEKTNYKQLVYQSDNRHNCRPVILPDKINVNDYPYVIEAPVGMTNPRYNWDKNIWEDLDVESQAGALAGLHDKVDNLNTNVVGVQQSVGDMHGELKYTQKQMADILLRFISEDAMATEDDITKSK